VQEPSAVRSLRIRYILGLTTVAILVTTSWFTLQTAVAKQENFSQLVNIAAHQRGNAERIVLFAMTMANAADEGEFQMARGQLGRVINTTEAAHAILLNGDVEKNIPKVMTPLLNIIYFDQQAGLDLALTRYLERARDVYDTPFGSIASNSGAYVFLVQYGPHVINSLFDSAVEEYERYGKAAIRDIKQLETTLWITALIILLIEAFVIFRPMERKVKEALRALRNKNTDLEKTVVELVSAKSELASSEQNFRAMAASVPGVIFQMVERRGGHRDYIYVSPRCSDLYGVSPDELKKDWEALRLHPEDKDRFLETIRDAFQNQTEWSFEGRVLTETGEPKWWRGISTPVPVNDDEVVFNGVMIDITSQKKMEEQLRKLATTDSLTGAFNRRHFYTLAENEISRAQRNGQPLTFMALDIDHFKKINDTFGHAGGDEALKRAVERISAQLRSIDILARFGGEEFSICVPETSSEGAMVLAERIRQEIADMSVEWEVISFGFTISIGVSEWRADDGNIDDVLERADQGLYQAKTRGRNCVVLYTDAMLQGLEEQAAS